MGDGWETARKPDRPAVLDIGPDGLVKVGSLSPPCPVHVRGATAFLFLVVRSV